MRDERLGRRPARNRLQHRRLDLHVTVAYEELAHCLNDPGARHEHPARILVGDQVEITLAVFLFLIGQAVEFFRQWAQRLGQQAHLLDAHGKLAGFGLEQHADSAENVAEIIMFECVVRFLAGVVIADEQLYLSAHVLQRGKARLAHHALQHHAPGHGNMYLRGFQFFMRPPAEFVMQIARQMLALEVVRESDACLTYRIELAAAFRDDLVVVLWRDLFVHRYISQK